MWLHRLLVQSPNGSSEEARHLWPWKQQFLLWWNIYFFHLLLFLLFSLLLPCYNTLQVPFVALIPVGAAASNKAASPPPHCISSLKELYGYDIRCQQTSIFKAQLVRKLLSLIARFSYSYTFLCSVEQKLLYNLFKKHLHRGHRWLYRENRGSWNIWFWLMWSFFFVCFPLGRQSDSQPGHQTGQQGDWSQGKLPLELREERLRREKEKHEEACWVSAPKYSILQVSLRPVQLIAHFNSLCEATPFSSNKCFAHKSRKYSWKGEAFLLH